MFYKRILSLAYNFLLLGYSFQSLRKEHDFEVFYRNRKVSTDILWQTNVSSLVMCTTVCGIDELCKSISYEGDINTCTGHNVCPSQDGVTTSYCSGCIVMRNQNVQCTLIETTTALPQDRCIGNENGGTPFTDESFSLGKNITSIKMVCANENVEQIQVRYGSTWANAHPGGKVATELTCTLAADEYVTKVFAKLHGFNLHDMVQLIITTNQQEFPECGSPGYGEPVTVSGRRLLYISGREGGGLDCLSFHWA